MKYYLKYDPFAVKANHSAEDAYDSDASWEDTAKLVENSGAQIIDLGQETETVDPYTGDWQMTIECSDRQWRQIQLFLDPKIWYTSQEDDDLREEQWEIQEEYCERKYANWKPKPPETDPTKLKQFLARFV